MDSYRATVVNQRNGNAHGTPRSLGGRRISVQTAEKSVSFVDTSSANSYGYWLVSITKRYSIFDGLPSKPSAAQTPSRSLGMHIRTHCRAALQKSGLVVGQLSAQHAIPKAEHQREIASG
jgi:hypothetical protein